MLWGGMAASPVGLTWGPTSWILGTTSRRVPRESGGNGLARFWSVPGARSSRAQDALLDERDAITRAYARARRRVQSLPAVEQARMYQDLRTNQFRTFDVLRRLSGLAAEEARSRPRPSA